MSSTKRLLASVSVGMAWASLIGLSAPARATAADTPTAIQSATGTRYVIGYFKRGRECKKAGWHGRRLHVWSEFSAYRARLPEHGLVWVLEVAETDWLWTAWNGTPKSWPYRPDHLARAAYRIGEPYEHPLAARPGVKS
jgi:hypothetical protein